MRKMRIGILGAVCMTCALLGAGLAQNVASADMPAEVSTFEILDVASVRTGAPEGIRFLARIKTSEKEALQNATFGAIVYPTAQIEGEFTKDDATDVLDIVAEKWLAESLYEEYELDAEYSYFTAVVAGKEDTFPASFYNTSLSARGYVQIGENAPIYTENTVERSMSYVARMALANGEADVNGVLAKVTAGVSVNVNEVSYCLNKGETDKITFTYGGIALEQSDLVKITYEVDNEGVAIVSADGTITAIGGGAVGITATVDIGGQVSIYNLGVKVIEPIVATENLAQSKYFGYYTTVCVVTDFADGGVKLTTEGNAPNASYTDRCFLNINKEIIKAGIDAGYTSIQVVMATEACGMAVYNNGALTAYKGNAGGTHTYDLATYKDNGIKLDFFNGAGGPLDVTIAGIYFVGNLNLDFSKNVISEDMANYFVNRTANLTVAYEANATVNGATVKAIHVTSTENAPADPGHRTHNAIIGTQLINAAIADGHTKITVTVYTANGFDLYKANQDGQYLGLKRNDGSTSAREITVTYDLSQVSANGLYFCFGGNANGGIPVDAYITNIVFSGKPIDYSKNILSAELLSSISCTRTSAAYVENAVINSNVTANAIHITSTENVSYDPGANIDGAGIYYFNIGADLFNAAKEQGYTKIVIEVYTNNNIDTCVSHWVTQMQGWYRDNTLDQKTTITRDVDTYTGYGLFLMLGYIGEPAPANVYITSISFTK